VSQLAGNSVAKAQAQPLPHAPQSHACRGVMIPLECARPQEWMRAYSLASLSATTLRASLHAVQACARRGRHKPEESQGGEEAVDALGVVGR